MKHLILFLSLFCAIGLAADVYFQEKDASGTWVNQTKFPDGSALPVTAGGTVITSVTGTNYTATNTSGTCIAANTSRKDLTIVNWGSTAVFLSRGNTATANKGIYILGNGGSYQIDATNLYQGVLTAITASGTSTMTVSEGQ